MRSTNYTDKLNLGEGDGMRNILVRTSRDIEALPTGQRPWATILRVPLLKDSFNNKKGASHATAEVQ